MSESTWNTQKTIQSNFEKSRLRSTEGMKTQNTIQSNLEKNRRRSTEGMRKLRKTSVGHKQPTGANCTKTLAAVHINKTVDIVGRDDIELRREGRQ